mmetsp:Transcript_35720/g.55753  ORF Transcript_35720/g.55753 Transcript_35720/m.55753 type:complete len:126 (-) Transcript_35720:82-459(-)
MHGTARLGTGCWCSLTARALSAWHQRHHAGVDRPEQANKARKRGLEGQLHGAGPEQPARADELFVQGRAQFWAAFAMSEAVCCSCFSICCVLPSFCTVTTRSKHQLWLQISSAALRSLEPCATSL